MEVITSHINADFDTLGSMVAAKKLYPDALMVFSGSQERSLRNFFLQSVAYAFEFERVKNIDLDSISRLILVDIRQASRIGKFAEILDKPDLDIHIYDHHPDVEGDICGSVQVIKFVGSTSTIFTHIIRERGMELTVEEATMLMLGIHEDTGSLTFSSTRKEDYEAAAYLIQKGANLNMVSDMITKELTSEQVHLLDELIQSLQRQHINGIEVAFALGSVDKYIGDLAVLVHMLKDMENLNVLFAAVRMEDRVYLIARSRIPEVNVGEIAAEFGGGGHAQASSATIRDITLFQVRDRLFAILRKKIKAVRQARDLMTFPVKMISPEETIRSAREAMTRYNINVLPVVEGESVVGLVPRQVVEKGSFHGLEEVPVREYMISDFFTVNPDASLQKIKEIIIEQNQRLLPVVKGSRIVGGITRMDLLRALYFYGDNVQMEDEAEEKEGHYPRSKQVGKYMKERIPSFLVKILRELGELARKMKMEAYLVGGCVRDLLLNEKNFDMDIVVEGDGIALAQAFAESNGWKIKKHPKFGTATIILPDRVKIDVVTARMEFYEKPGALPKVERGSLRHDLYRRDFTINTLAVNLTPPHYGELIDFFNAQRDIKERVIRILHNLSFVEDPTRAFRAIRFEQRYGFRIGKQTEQLIRNAVKNDLFSQLSGARLSNELFLILGEKNPVLMMTRMKELDLLPVLHPQIKLLAGQLRFLKNLEEVISWYDLLFLEQPYDRAMVFFLGVIDPLSDQETQEFISRLHIVRKGVRRLIAARHQGQEVLHRLNRMRKLSISRIFFLLRPFSTELLLYLMARAEVRSSKKAISQYITHWKETSVQMTGRDLKRLKLQPGPLYQEIFERLLVERLDGHLQTKQDELEFVRQNYL